MASFEKRGSKTKAIVFLNGERKSKTCRTYALAKKWANDLEDKRDMDGVVELPSHDLVGSVIDRYVKDDGNWGPDKAHHLKKLNQGLGHVPLSKLTRQTIVAYIVGLKLAPSNAQSRLSYLSSVLLQAKVEYGLTVRDKDMEDARELLAKKKLIGQSRPRTRRPVEGEIEAIAAAHVDTTRSCDLREIIEILSILPIRCGELLNIRWTDINRAKRTVMLRERKDPDRRIKETKNEIIPLLRVGDKDTYDLIVTNRKRFDNQEGPFPYEVKAVSNAMILARTKAEVTDQQMLGTLHVHDLRAHAISHMLEKDVEPPMVMLISGHKNAAVFYRNYVRLDVEKVRQNIERKLAA